ncbi:MAG: HNH endonuclease [Bacteroidales bacterium]|jgi:hypothetical protein|nr:HNH endonuclease [Bacteroidales bacterium]
MVLFTGLPLLAGVKGAKTVANVAISGNDPTVTDAFLVAAGLGISVKNYFNESLVPISQKADTELSSKSADIDPPSTDINIDSLSDNMHLDSAQSQINSEVFDDIPAKPSINWEKTFFSVDQPDVNTLSFDKNSSLLTTIMQKLSMSYSDQIAEGNNIIVLGTNINSVNQKNVDGNIITTISAEQHIADAREFRFDNLMSMLYKCNSGENIPVTDVFLAVVSDLFSGNINIIKAILKPFDVINSLKGSRTIDIEIISSAVTRYDVDQDNHKLNINLNSTYVDDSNELSINLNDLTTLNAERLTKIQSNVVNYHYGQVIFKDIEPEESHPFLAEQDFVDSNILMDEQIKITESRQVQAESTSEIGQLNKTALSDIDNNQTIITSQTFLSANRDIREAVADGELTDEEIESFDMNQEFSESNQEHIQFKESPYLHQSLLTEQESILNSMVEQIESGQQVSIEQMYQASQEMLSTVSPTLDSSIKNPGLSSHNVTKSAIQTGETAVKENIEQATLGFGTKTVTKDITQKQITVTRDAQANHIQMSVNSTGAGIYSDYTMFEPYTERLTFIEIIAQTAIDTSSTPESTKSRTVFGADSKKVLGSSVETGSTTFNRSGNVTSTLYSVYDHDISEIKQAISDTHLTENEIKSLNASLLYSNQVEVPTESRVDDSTIQSEYNEGVIGYVPVVGSVSNIAMKSSFGHKIELIDVAMLGVDAITIPLSAGVASVFTKGAKGAVMAAKMGNFSKAGKGLVDMAGKTASLSVKNLKNDATEMFKTGNDAVQYVAKHGPRKAVKEGYNQVAGRAKMLDNKIFGDNTRNDLSKLSSDGKHGLIGNKSKINYDSAGTTANFQKGSDLAKKYPNGVDFNNSGYPDFSSYAKHRVTIKDLDGKPPYTSDYAKANKAAGIDKLPQDYVWHHHENGTDMLAVPKDLHDAVRHSGGASLLRQQDEFIDRTIRTTSKGVQVTTSTVSTALDSNNSDVDVNFDPKTTK